MYITYEKIVNNLDMLQRKAKEPNFPASYPLQPIHSNEKALAILAGLKGIAGDLNLATRVKLFRTLGPLNGMALAGATCDYRGYLTAFGNRVPLIHFSPCLIHDLQGVSIGDLDALIKLYGGFEEIPLSLYSFMAINLDCEAFAYLSQKYPQAILDYTYRLVNQIHLSPNSSNPDIKCLTAITASGIIPELISKGYKSIYSSYSRSLMDELISPRKPRDKSFYMVASAIDSLDWAMRAGQAMREVDKKIGGDTNSGRATRIINEALTSYPDLMGDIALRDRDVVVLVSALLVGQELADRATMAFGDDFGEDDNCESIKDLMEKDPEPLPGVLIVEAIGLHKDAHKANRIAKLLLHAGLLNNDENETMLGMIKLGFHPSILNLVQSAKKYVALQAMHL